MALTPGTRLGPYEVTAAIGAGGMGEVYRARDTKLDRDVAVKVLPESFASDTDRLARFQREAKTLASLNHPNIAAIYGIEGNALVMELVDGEDLSALIARGPVSLPDALPIARQIADALEAAHEQAIIHRDLKPANVKVRADGTVKVLDFGLAKALDPNASAATTEATNSPTLTGRATQAGVIIGTAAYMAPEQARGRAVDKRADIWAFGAVLFEMLTGTRAFPGEDITDTLAAVVRAEPEWGLLPKDCSPTLLVFLRRCLQKDPKQRVGDIHDVRLALDGAFDTAPALPSPAAAPVVSRTRERVAWAAALGVASLAALALAAFTYLGRAPAEVRQTRFFVSPPDGWRVTTGLTLGGLSPAPLAVSPDGSRIAFLANAATGRSRLWVRALDTLTAQELPGTDGALSPFWSPDSRSLAFFADGKLKRIEVAGGPAVTLCDSTGSLGGTWNQDGVIVFSPGASSALQRVSASGGVPSPATVLGDGEPNHMRPSFLPDGQHFVYRVGNGGVYLTSLDATARTLLLKNPDSTNVLYSRGHLLFLRETTLMAQPFDLDRLTLTGEPVPVAEQIQTTATPPNAFFSASDTGVLVYQTGTSSGSNRQLTWFDRAGKVLGLVEKPGLYNTVALSPDGTRGVVSVNDPQAAGRAGGAPGNVDLWVHEFARSTSTRLTFDPAADYVAVWSPDGSRLAWSTNRDGVYNLYQKVSNGASPDEALLKSSDPKFPYDWSPDGRFLLYGILKGGYTLWVLPLTADDRTPRLYLEQAGFNITQAKFSPDGRYVAYTSNASGSNEVYVQPFPAAAGGRWMVSQGGGNQPHWRRDGKELFYIALDSKMMAVPVATTPAFLPGVPKALFPATIFGSGTTLNVTRYDVTADGQKFLVNVVPPETTAAPPSPIRVVLNWTAGLRK